MGCQSKIAKKDDQRVTGFDNEDALINHMVDIWKSDVVEADANSGISAFFTVASKMLR